jgi:hypothetical protein
MEGIWEDNINIDRREIGCECERWMELAQDRGIGGAERSCTEIIFAHFRPYARCFGPISLTVTV